jgi:Xaa-Pro aminopeptidase
VEFRAFDSHLDELQGVKTAAEIELLKDSANATLDAVLKTIAEVDSSHTERGVSNLIHRRLVESGGDPTFLVFAAGERTMHGHPEPRDEPLTPGSIWRTDLGARYRFGFNSDVARTGVVGEPSAAQAQTLAALHAAQGAAIGIAEPGRPARELFEACRETAIREGLSFTMPHIGHSLGIGLHEQPMLEPRNHQQLRAGMVLNIEPLVIVAERHEAYHTEDLVLVGENGPVRLTQPQTELLRIPAL